MIAIKQYNYKKVEIPKELVPAEIIGKEFGVYIVFVSGYPKQRNKKIKLIEKFIKKMK